MLAGVAPITRTVSPSIRISDVSGCARPVQCTVAASVSRSAGDQMEKYGSEATRGTAGGRSTEAPAAADTGRSGTSRCGVAPARAIDTKNAAAAATHRIAYRGVIVDNPRASLRSVLGESGKLRDANVGAAVRQERDGLLRLVRDAPARVRRGAVWRRDLRRPARIDLPRRDHSGPRPRRHAGAVRREWPRADGAFFECQARHAVAV